MKAGILKKAVWVVGVTLLIMALGGCIQGTDTLPAVELKPVAIEKNGLTLLVDSRMELLSIVQYLSEYDSRYGLMTRLNFDYKELVEEHFASFHTHEAVKEFDRLSRDNFTFDAPPATMLFLTEQLTLRQDAEIYPYLLGRIGGKGNLNQFQAALADFVVASGFEDFFAANQNFYQALLEQTAAKLPQESLIDELEQYYGMEQHGYYIILTPLFHHGGFGPAVQLADGSLDIYSIIGPGEVSPVSGLPEFGSPEDFLYLQRHEFSHSFVNPTTAQYIDLVKAYEHLYDRVKEEMAYQAYGDWTTTVNEHLVRAVTTRLAYGESREAGEDARKAELERGFIFLDPLLEKLAYYEQHRGQYPDFASFYPELIKAFEEIE